MTYFSDNGFWSVERLPKSIRTSRCLFFLFSEYLFSFSSVILIFSPFNFSYWNYRSDIISAAALIHLMMIKSIVGISEFYTYVLPPLLKGDITAFPYPEALLSFFSSFFFLFFSYSLLIEDNIFFYRTMLCSFVISWPRSPSYLVAASQQSSYLFPSSFSHYFTELYKYIFYFWFRSLEFQWRQWSQRPCFPSWTFSSQPSRGAQPLPPSPILSIN